MKGELVLGGHAMLIVGYKKIRRTPYFIVRNSEGWVQVGEIMNIVIFPPALLPKELILTFGRADKRGIGFVQKPKHQMDWITELQQSQRL